MNEEDKIAKEFTEYLKDTARYYEYPRTYEIEYLTARFCINKLEKERDNITMEIFNNDDIAYALNYCYSEEQQEVIRNKYLRSK